MLNGMRKRGKHGKEWTPIKRNDDLLNIQWPVISAGLGGATLSINERLRCDAATARRHIWNNCDKFYISYSGRVSCDLRIPSTSRFKTNCKSLAISNELIATQHSITHVWQSARSYAISSFCRAPVHHYPWMFDYILCTYLIAFYETTFYLQQAILDKHVDSILLQLSTPSLRWYLRYGSWEPIPPDRIALGSHYFLISAAIVEIVTGTNS